MPKPAAPTSDPKEPANWPEWDDYYDACEEWAGMQKPCMDRNDT